MKIAALVARVLLGLIFLFSGIAKFFPMQQPPPPSPVAGQFFTALMASKYILVLGVFEAVGGLLLLIPRFVPLGLCVLAPIIVNIFLVGVLMSVSQALVSSLVLTLLWVIIFLRFRQAFEGIFAARHANERGRVTSPSCPAPAGRAAGLRWRYGLE